MIQSSIIPRATARHQLTGFGLSQQVSDTKTRHENVVRQDLYEEEELGQFSTTLSSSLGLSLPNPAPMVEIEANEAAVTSPDLRGEKRPHGEIVDIDESIPKKKKYAKEAWPGRKPGPGQGLF